MTIIFRTTGRLRELSGREGPSGSLEDILIEGAPINFPVNADKTLSPEHAHNISLGDKSFTRGVQPTIDSLGRDVHPSAESLGRALPSELMHKETYARSTDSLSRSTPPSLPARSNNGSIKRTKQRTSEESLARGTQRPSNGSLISDAQRPSNGSLNREAQSEANGVIPLRSKERGDKSGPPAYSDCRSPA